MNIQLIVNYVLIFVFCSITVYVSFKLYEKYRLKFLYFFLYYIIVLNILGFFYLFGAYLNNQLLFFSSGSKNLFTELLGFLVFPLIPVMLFMYINFIAELLKKRFSKGLKNIFLIFWGILVIVFMITAGRFFVTRDNRFLMAIWAVTYLSEGMILLAANSYLILKARLIVDKNRRKALLTIGWMYFFVLAVYAVFFLHLISPSFNIFLILHFSYNVPPLFFLAWHLKKHHSEVILPRIEAGNLDNFFNAHNITQREREVIMLLLEGKRTKDIEKELFISYHTVKNHIHNIYQKLDVRNRLQITSLIRDHLDSSQQ